MKNEYKKAKLVFKNGTVRWWTVGQIMDVLYLLKEPKRLKHTLEEFVECTPDNIIKHGGFSQINYVIPERIEFRLTYQIDEITYEYREV